MVCAIAYYLLMSVAIIDRMTGRLSSMIIHDALYMILQILATSPIIKFVEPY